MGTQPQLLKGLTDLALLSSLSDGPSYGLQLLDRLRQEAGMPISEGSIYPLLHRLEKSAWVKSEWLLDAGQPRPRKYYSLTARGRTSLNASIREWLEISSALTDFLLRSSK